MIFKTAEKSKIIIDYINEYYDKYYRSPSLRDIEAAVGIPRTTVGLYLNNLKTEGVIDYDGKRETIITDYIKSVAEKKTERLNICNKNDNLMASWFVHGFANLAINTIGTFMILGG